MYYGEIYFNLLFIIKSTMNFGVIKFNEILKTKNSAYDNVCGIIYKLHQTQKRSMVFRNTLQQQILIRFHVITLDFSQFEFPCTAPSKKN